MPEFLLQIMGFAWWLVTVALAIALYEALRASVLRGFRLRLQRSASRYLARHRVRLDRFKFVQKHYVRESLLNDRDLAESMLECSRDSGEPIEELRRRTEVYIEEIVPYFNLVSYYKVGLNVAKSLMGALYDVSFSRENLRGAWKAAEGRDATVFVINHRSNADYVLLAHALSREVALSYAVGEWARVWPLEGLFKSFGSYFVRRGERDPLYHRVLQRYIQLVTMGGLAQGFFIEGKLTRSGRMGPPKLGLLEHLVGVFEHGFEGDVRFVPIGLNFDRVLEDTRLLAEGRGPAPTPPTFTEKLQSAASLVATLPPAIVGRASRLLEGAWRFARRGRLGFGVAAAHAGPSLGFREFFGDALEEVLALSREERKPHLERFADELVRRIGEQIPVSAVPVFSQAVLDVVPEGEFVAEDVVVGRIRELLDQLRAAGAPMMLGGRFADLEAERAADASGAAGGARGLSGLQEDLIGADEALGVFTAATEILRRRRAVAVGPAGVTCAPAGVELLRYYAWSIEPHLQRGEGEAGAPAAEPDASEAPIDEGAPEPVDPEPPAVDPRYAALPMDHSAPHLNPVGSGKDDDDWEPW